MATHVHTLGDSTLDNLYWRLRATPNLETARTSSVEGRLQNILGHAFEVISHAFDGFTTKSVLNGANVGDVLPRNGTTLQTYMAQKAPNQRFVKPLEELQTEISRDSNGTHYVVLSVCGNDFRENLLNPISFLKDIPQIQKRYLQIVERLKTLKGRDVRPILMLQYRTDAKNDPYLIYTVLKIIGIVALIAQIGCFALLTAPIWLIAGQVSALVCGLAFAGGVLGLYFTKKVLPLSALKDIILGKKISMLCLETLLQSFYRPILEQAKKDSIPVLDLPNTFNPNNDLYDSGIEPGKQGAELIAEGVAHIVNNHDYSKPSQLYSKTKDVYEGAINEPSNWKVAYPS